MRIKLEVRPRQTWTWDEFQAIAPRRAIALDGMVLGGPRWDEQTLHVNFDHHDGVVREATMSTAKQVYFAIKLGLPEAFAHRAHVFVNDPDQDTALAVWLLENSKMFEGTGSLPAVNRLLELNDRLDITGGAFPMNLEDDLLGTHNWIFRPYTDARTSGALASMDAGHMEALLVQTLGRLSHFSLGDAQRVELRRHVEMKRDDGWLKFYEETDGNEARYALFSQGMDAFVAQVAKRPDGNFVYSIGRRSRYVTRFPLPKLYLALSERERFIRDTFNVSGDAEDPALSLWGGSDIIGGSPRLTGSILSLDEVQTVVLRVLMRHG